MSAIFCLPSSVSAPPSASPICVRNLRNLKNNDLYIEPRAKRSKKAKTLNALGKAEEKRLQGILEQIQTKHDNRYGQPYSPVDKTPIGTPLTSSPKDKPVVSKKKANESVISNTKKDKSLIDEEVRNITPDIKAYALPSMLNLDLGTEKEVDVAGNIVEDQLKNNKIAHTDAYLSRKIITRSVDGLNRDKPNGNFNGKNALCINFEDNLPDIGVVMSEVLMRHNGYNVFNSGSHAELGELSEIIIKRKICLLYTSPSPRDS